MLSSALSSIQWKKKSINDTFVHLSIYPLFRKYLLHKKVIELYILYLKFKVCKARTDMHSRATPWLKLYNFYITSKYTCTCKEILQVCILIAILFSGSTVSNLSISDFWRLLKKNNWCYHLFFLYIELLLPVLVIDLGKMNLYQISLLYN